MDLPTIAWLQDFLTTQRSDLIVLFVSHDRAFLSTVATDIIEMKDMQLHYFSGGYEDYLRNKEEMAARKANLFDAKARKEAHLVKSIEQSQQRGDDKSIRNKQKKLERVNMASRMDGHKFKLFSLSEIVSISSLFALLSNVFCGVHRMRKLCACLIVSMV